MEKLKKPYTAPAAELLLLAPAEAVATGEISQNDQIAMNQWAMNEWNYKVLPSASITGSNRTYWGEDGKITKK